MNKPIILISNDDGIFAGGIAMLVSVAKELGEVIVVAPDSPQSAKSNAITVSQPLRLRATDIFEGVEAYKVDGTPADCVKLAKHVVLKDRPIDLCVTGINHGSNASINIIYSGTMGAAMEASITGINSIGFSLLDFAPDADFSQGRKFVKAIMEHTLEHGLGNTNLLNVNIPNLPEAEIKGIKVCRQANANWKEVFVEKTDPYGGKYYWLTGEFLNNDSGEDTDLWALQNGYVSVVPSGHDLTVYKALEDLAPLNSIQSVTL